MSGFNEMMKILQDVPTNDKSFRSSVKTNFSKCTQNVLKDHNVQLYIECNICRGFQSHPMVEIDKPAECQQCGIALKNENYFIYMGFTDQLTSMLKVHFVDILAYCAKTLRRTINRNSRYLGW